MTCHHGHDSTVYSVDEAMHEFCRVLDASCMYVHSHVRDQRDL